MRSVVGTIILHKIIHINKDVTTSISNILPYIINLALLATLSQSIAHLQSKFFELLGKDR